MLYGIMKTTPINDTYGGEVNTLVSTRVGKLNKDLNALIARANRVPGRVHIIDLNNKVVWEKV